MNRNESEIIADRISPAAEFGREQGGQLLVEATYLAARCQKAGVENKVSEPVSRKERARFNELVRPLEEEALLNWSTGAGLLQEELHFSKHYGDRKIGAGAEQQIYLMHDGLRVVKTNDAIMHGSWLEFFDRLALHNWLFPETAYLLTGFTFVKYRLAAIIEQAFIISDRGAARHEVAADLLKRGFLRLRNDDYYSEELGILLEDLHDENVLAGPDNILFYIDPIPYLETPEMNLKGKSLYHFPFAQ